MDNLNVTSQTEQSSQGSQKSAPWPLIAIIILIIIGIAFAWQFTGTIEEPEVVTVPTPIIEPVVEEITEVIEPPEPIVEPEPVIEDVIEPEPAVVENPLPLLDESDEWLKIRLPELTWRKELLKLVIDEDMIRRFVVFTDNFAQGTLAYEHSPFTLPKSKFSPNSETAMNGNTWQWSENTTKRFNLYVDLLRSLDSENLVLWYHEMKPLIDEAYAELGYGDEDFTDTLQDAITRVLDMELPSQENMQLTRPSVMYQFSDPALESLPETDKLLLRLGKDNLLVIKSVLLELYEKLAQLDNGVH